MAESLKSVKRRRPEKFTLDCTYKTEFYLPQIEYDYLKAKQQKFVACNYNQSLTKMIYSITSYFYKFKVFSSTSIISLLEDSVKKLLITEIELVISSFYLEALLHNDAFQNTEDLVIFTLFQSKKFFSSNLKIIKILEGYYQKIFASYEKYFDLEIFKRSFDLKSINRRFKELKGDCSTFPINYSYYVDEILRGSSPYTITGENRQNSFESKTQKKFKISESESKDLEEKAICKKKKSFETDEGLELYCQEYLFEKKHRENDKDESVCSKDTFDTDLFFADI